MKYKYRHRETYKDIKIDVKANTTTDLMKKVAKRRREIDTLEKSAKDIRLKELIETFLAVKSESVSATRYRIIKWIFWNFYDYIGNKKISKITVQDVQDYALTLSNRSTQSIQTIMSAVFMLLAHARKMGYTDKNFYDLVIKPKGQPPKETRSLTPKEQADFLELIKGSKYETFFRIMLFCGLRPSEVLNLRWTDIRGGFIHVTKSKTPAGIRKVPVPAASGITGKNSFDFVCPYKHKAIDNWWRRNFKPKMDIDLPMYCLRHTYCTNLERQGVPINIARQLMGHADINTTSKIYTHSSDESLEIARALIDAGNCAGNIAKTVEISTK